MTLHMDRDETEVALLALRSYAHYHHFAAIDEGLNVEGRGVRPERVAHHEAVRDTSYRLQREIEAQRDGSGT